MFSQRIFSKVMEVVAPTPLPIPDFPTAYDISNAKQYDGTGQF